MSDGKKFWSKTIRGRNITIFQNIAFFTTIKFSEENCLIFREIDYQNTLSFLLWPKPPYGDSVTNLSIALTTF